MRFNPQHKCVYGFVYFDYLKWGLRFVRFMAHCVIEVEDGTLVDITPHNTSAGYPFIRYSGTDEEFAGIVSAGPRIGLDLVIP